MSDPNLDSRVSSSFLPQILPRHDRGGGRGRTRLRGSHLDGQGREADAPGDRQQQRAATHAEHKRRLPELATDAATPRGRKVEQGRWMVVLKSCLVSGTLKL